MRSAYPTPITGHRHYHAEYRASSATRMKDRLRFTVVFAQIIGPLLHSGMKSCNHPKRSFESLFLSAQFRSGTLRAPDSPVSPGPRSPPPPPAPPSPPLPEVVETVTRWPQTPPTPLRRAEENLSIPADVP